MTPINVKSMRFLEAESYRRPGAYLKGTSAGLKHTTKGFAIFKLFVCGFTPGDEDCAYIFAFPFAVETLSKRKCEEVEEVQGNESISWKIRLTIDKMTANVSDIYIPMIAFLLLYSDA